MKNRLIIIFLFLVLLGCDRISPFALVKEKETKENIYKGPFLARVNGWVLTPEDFQEEIRRVLDSNNGDSEIQVERLGLLFGTLVNPQLQTIDLRSAIGKQYYLDYLVNLHLLAKEAKDQGINKEPEIARNIQRSTAEILDFALLNRVLKKINVTSLEIENFYHNEYKKTLEGMELRKVREIVVNSESRARDILVKILRGEADFATLARNNSIVESARSGGDLGYLTYQPNQKFVRFWESVLSLDEGQISSIFKNPETDNYYIVKVEDIKKGEPESLDKIYDQLEFILKQRKGLEALSKLINEAKSKAEVITNPDLMR